MNTSDMRKAVTDAQILAVSCPTCHCLSGLGCLTPERRVFATEVGSNKLSFHSERISAAYALQFAVAFGGLDPSTKALAIFYAYGMLCDSVSLKSVELLGRFHTSTQIQTYFAQKAIAEMKKDGLLE